MALLRLTAFAVLGMLGKDGALPSMMMLRLLNESFGHAEVENIAKPAAPETLGEPDMGDGDMMCSFGIGVRGEREWFVY